MSSSTRSIGVGLLLVGLLFLLNAAWFLPYFLQIPAETRMSQYAGSWQYQGFYIGYLVALVLLAVQVPGWRAVAGRTGRTLPGWLLRGLLVAVMLQAATVFTQAFVAPFLAEAAPAALDIDGFNTFAAAMTGIWVLWIIALVTLAVVAAVRRVMGIGSAVLIGVGALIIPMFGPVGAVPIGIGLGLWGLRILRTPRQVEYNTGVRQAQPVGI